MKHWRPIVSKFSGRSLGKKFSEAATIRDSLITRDESSRFKGNGHRYIINLERADTPPQNITDCCCTDRRRAGGDRPRKELGVIGVGVTKNKSVPDYAY